MTRIDYSSLSFNRLQTPVEALLCVFADHSGCKIAESTVVSKKLHIYLPGRPQEIQIMCNVDAGRLFYNRPDYGTIIHMDIFHEYGLVDHHQIAAALRDAVAHYNTSLLLDEPANRHAADANLIDIQTGTGGGRITGNLAYGQKTSLQNAHKNHVHIAAMLPDEHAACLFFLILAAESTILTCGLELRCIEKVVLTASCGNQLLDLSEYTDQTDSYLKSQKHGGQHQTVSQLSQQQDNSETAACTIKPTAAHAPLQSLNAKVQHEGQCNQQTLLGFSGQKLPTRATSQQPQYNLQPLADIADMEQHIRKQLRPKRQNLPAKCRLSDQQDAVAARKTNHLALEKTLAAVLDITATVQAAAARQLTTAIPALNISGLDLRFHGANASQRSDLCVLLDASASMEGLRLQMAKTLIARLLHSTGCRISLITFQDSAAQFVLPFTRNESRLRAELKTIQAYGATPLALGLKSGMDYLKSSHPHNPFLILITDGLPSYASGNTGDPLSDAMIAAREIKAAHYKFTCIGLESQQNYLVELAKNAGGSVFQKNHSLINGKLPFSASR
jgi:magnesium chelatase subunit D